MKKSMFFQIDLNKKHLKDDSQQTDIFGFLLERFAETF